jgi:hypothetical protein
MKKVISLTLLLAFVGSFISCDKFLDVVPHDTATIQKSFKRRSQAKKFLYTIYSYLPQFGSVGLSETASFLSSIETWKPEAAITNGGYIKRGEQKVVDPYLNFWDGSGGGYGLYRGIRYCNIFLKNISKVGNMTHVQKEKWTGEVKFLKAYFTFYLTRMYGPIVLQTIKHNIPVSASKEETEFVRAPTDSSFKYIEKLLTEVIHNPYLPATIDNKQQNYGRVTKSIAYAVKAKVEVTAASPLFNGNNNYTGFKNKNGENPFSTKKNPAKWDSAVTACKKAVDYIESHNFHFYKFSNSSVVGSNVSDSTKLKLTLRNSVTLGINKFNPGVIWAYTNQSTNTLQSDVIPVGLNHKNPVNVGVNGNWSVPLKVTELFYTDHGLPIQDDKTWDYSNRFDVQTVGKDERYYLKQSYKTAALNMHRGGRYYADLDFDGSIHFGNGSYDGDPSQDVYIQAKKGQINWPEVQPGQYNVTGYWVKKLLNYQTEEGDTGSDMTYNDYNWPIMRVADLYLLYAEAKNEADGPGPIVYKYLNKVRKHAGLPTVQDAWDKYSDNPNKYTTKKGLRDIIHRERLIELMFEGQWYWDVRRWKIAPNLINQSITGWSRDFEKAKNYYRPKVIFHREFHLKDYFWPLSENVLNRNPKLTQNPGWGR